MNPVKLTSQSAPNVMGSYCSCADLCGNIVYFSSVTTPQDGAHCHCRQGRVMVIDGEELI
jgi:hypothetical protein